MGQPWSELSDVKEHDQLVTNQAQQAQENLKAALAESEKNAGLLTEYHELYELQRKRLETQVSSLTEERELWSHAAYSLALKVTDANSLASAKRLHMSEKGWSKLATHFTIVLGDKDTEQLSTLQGYVDKFRELIGDFHQQLLKSDEKSRVRLSQIKKGIQKWIEEFQREIIFPKELSQTHTPDTFSTSFRHSSMSGRPPDYSVMPPDRETIGKLFQDMRFWEETINKEVEKFGGDVLLSFEESMYHINKQMEGWTETALKVFSRHLSDDGTEFPAHEKMLVMNKLVENFMELFKVRVNGENGVAKGFITLANAMEPWDSRLNQIVNGGSLPPESEWGRLYDLFDDWIITVDDTFTLVGSTQKEEDRNANKEHKPITIEHIFRNTQTWLTTTINGVDNEDAKLVEQVRVLHAEIVHWMIQVLLRLAPDKADTPIEAIESSMAATSTTNDIKEKAESLFERLTNFSNYIIGETEERAQNAEEKVSELEDELKTALERLRAIDGKSVTPTIPENRTPSEDAKEAEVVKGKGKDKGKPPSTPTQMTVPEPSGAAKRPTSSTSVKSTGTPPRSPSQASHRSRQAHAHQRFPRNQNNFLTRIS
uniref:Axonemal dynein light chain domain-containing protein 1-like n=1 Tax=Saccoglossus kowalevskii TaxID=10224 RepID=A0ABM0MZ59_SACKO|nr:PREDICTED: axonemal dynein light chain domain-containing protein 1-like [Saccoglossus kowalevskii]